MKLVYLFYITIYSLYISQLDNEIKKLRQLKVS